MRGEPTTRPTTRQTPRLSPNINTYTDIYPILVAGRVLALTHLAAKDIFEDAHLIVVIVVTLCVIVRANTGIPPAATPPQPRLAASNSEAATPPSACVPSSAPFTSPEAPARLTSADGVTMSAPTSTLIAGQGGAGRGAARCQACTAPCMRHSADEMGWPG